MTIASTATPVSSADTPDRLRRYLVWLLAFTTAMWLLPFMLVCLPGFLRWSGSNYGPMLEYSFASRANADVVIFGDSSALFGIDPLQMSAQLGLKTINLPNTMSSLPVTDDMALRQYLSHNASPRLIVFYFSPWDLNFANVQNPDRLFDGEEMLLRHGSKRQIVDYSETHLREIAMFPFKFYTMNSVSVSLSGLWHWRQTPAIGPAMGHASLDLPQSKILKRPCELRVSVMQNAPFESGEALERRYSTDKTKVLFFMAPIPSCVNDGTLATLPYSTLHAAPPKEMDPSFYDDDGYFSHLDGRGVPEATNSLIAAVRSSLAIVMSSAIP
jgi:hypothetical protein